MNKNLLILGAGGHGRVVKEVAEAMGVFRRIDFVDDNLLDNEEVIGSCSDIEKFSGLYNYAIPSFGNNELRMSWINKLERYAFTIPLLIHPDAFISPSVLVFPGTVVEAKAIINTNSVINKGCIVSVGAIVDHDTYIGCGSHIDCGAIVKSNSVVKEYTKVESGKVFQQKEMQKTNEVLGVKVNS